MSFFDIVPFKTYATKENAVKAVEKAGFQSTRHFIMCHEDSRRFFPVFIGQEAVQRGIHFHFNVVG